MHTHLMSGGLTVNPQEMRTNFRQLLAWGVTSVFAMHIDPPPFCGIQEKLLRMMQPRFRISTLLAEDSPRSADTGRALQSKREQRCAN